MKGFLGFWALIQYTDAATASAARESLDGRSIPSYLLPEHVTSCCLRISFSAHKDLNIKFQSNRSSGNLLMLHSKQRPVYGGWEQHLGLEHTTTTPKRSYLGNNQSNYRTAIVLRSL
uniref:Uncharacterized protein n=1 Tax=Zea mays TaxID=4577 RepID=A0A804M347_MAIZE